MQKRSSSSIMHKIPQLNLFQRIFTDVDLYDSDSRRRIDLHIEIIEEFIDSNHISIPEMTDLVLDINLDTEGNSVTDYYFANHQLRIIFFLDNFSSDYIPNWGEIDGVSSGRHLRMSSLRYLLLNGSFSFTSPGHEIEAQYWCESQQLFI
jgi:hypothetical protein